MKIENSMWDECGKTGCAGGAGSLTYFLFVIWLVAMYGCLFAEPDSLKEYVKSFPIRIILAAVVTIPFYLIGWLLVKIGL